MDRQEALSNLKQLEQDKARIFSLNHLNSTWAFKNQCELRVKQINVCIRNLEESLKV